MRLISLLCLLSATAFAQVIKTTVTVSFPNCTGSTPASYDVDVYRPSGTGPFALVGIGHGFQNSKANHEVLARALAAKDIVVVIPQFPLYLSGQCGAGDHSRNADILWAAMDQERGVSSIDPLRIALAGHSAGGLSAFLAASRHTVQALLLFDAVDNGGLGAAQVANVSGPVMFLATEPSTCNSQNNSLPWFTDVSGLKGKLKVVGSSHCEPQDPLSSTCTFGCAGTTQQARQDLFKKYAVAFFDRFLNDVMTPCLDTVAQADVQAGTVANVDFQFGGCGAVTDAGSSVDAGADVDAGSVSDAGSALDAGVITDAGVEEDDAGVIVNDAGVTTDAGVSVTDAGVTTDAGTMQSVDGGSDGNTPTPAGCGCSSAGAWAVLSALTVLLLRRSAKLAAN